MATLSPARPSSATWRYAPQRVWLRRALFQVHLWLGLLTTLYAIAIGVSGSALVFKDQIFRGMHPGTVHLHHAGARMSLERLVTETRAAQPGWTLFAVRDFDKPDEATSLLLQSRADSMGADYRVISVDPWTGAVLADATRFGGVMGWLGNLHLYLLAGPLGLKISGWFALSLLLLSVTGVAVWWPGVRRAMAALVLHRRSSWKRVNWDLHAVIGFWTAGWLLVLSFTGLYFAFSEPVERLVLRATGSSLAEARRHDEPMPVPIAGLRGPLLTVDQAAARALAELPPDAPPDYLSLPAKPGAAYSITGYYRGTPPYSEMAHVTLDPHTGQVLTHSDTHDLVPGRRLIQYFFAVHFGSFGGEGAAGFAVRLLWFLLGLTPALLACTGVLMFWNRKLRPAYYRKLRARSR